MILDKQITLQITARNYNFYKDYGKVGDIINLDLSLIYSGSTIKISAKCDNCFNNYNISLVTYFQNYNIDNNYYCVKCKNIRSKITKLEKYGDENYNNRNKYKETCIEKYGVEFYNNSQKTKQTCLEKYGVENVFQNDVIKEKIINTNLNKYGVKYPQLNDDILKKTKNTLLNNYNSKYTFTSPIIKEKIKKTNLERYGSENIFRNKNLREKIQNKKNEKWIELLKSKYKYDFINFDFENKIIKIKCEKDHCYDISFGLFYNRNREINKTKLCTICNPIGIQNSGYEIELQNFIKDNYNYEILYNTKNIINPLELDIYIPELKLAFEFNGLFWHNELYKNKTYHKDKTELCKQKGIQLIHIYEDNWIYKQDIVKSRILNLLNKSNKIYARKCIIKEIKFNDARDFLQNNHIQGNVNAKYNIGLYYNDELVSLMSFGKKRKFMNSKSNENEYEMLRFCSKLNTNIIGGASKLFNYFIKTYNPTEVVSYADRSWSNGNLYKQLGFKYDNKTQPNYYYVIDGVRKHRFGFRKDILIKQGYDINKSEHEIMLERGIYRIYDSGHLKFIWN